MVRDLTFHRGFYDWVAVFKHDRLSLWNHASWCTRKKRWTWAKEDHWTEEEREKISDYLTESLKESEVYKNFKEKNPFHKRVKKGEER